MINNERVFAEINLDNISYNLNQISKLVKKDTKIMAIVKADAYGHGALEVAKTCVCNGASWLGVAIPEEGLYLRKNNISEPILILGHTIEAKIKEAIEYDLTQTVFSLEDAKIISKIASNLNKIANIHIKLDTGMSRLGFLFSQSSIETIVEISNLPFIKITGIFTHLANSDNEDKTFAKKQLLDFNLFLLGLKKRGINDTINHISNSGAVLNLPEFNVDMVRVGIITYGLYPSCRLEDKLSLLPAMSLKTYISLIKEIDKDISISYNRTYFTNGKTKIAIIPVGYADGYSRLLSNKAKVIINSQLAPIIGIICMDQMIVDVTNIENAKKGDEVILIGESGNVKVTAKELADLRNTIPYEVVCSISKRVPRVYIKEGKILKTIYN